MLILWLTVAAMASVTCSIEAAPGWREGRCISLGLSEELLGHCLGVRVLAFFIVFDGDMYQFSALQLVAERHGQYGVAAHIP